MNFKRYLASTFALFVFFFLYETAVHDFILLGLYKTTSNIWRSFTEMEANMPLAMLFQLLMSAWITFVFTQLYKNGGIKNGLRFGLFFGVFAGLLTASWYLWLPVPTALGFSWLICGIGEGIGGGYVLGLIYRQENTKSS